MDEFEHTIQPQPDKKNLLQRMLRTLKDDYQVLGQSYASIFRVGGLVVLVLGVFVSTRLASSNALLTTFARGENGQGESRTNISSLSIDCPDGGIVESTNRRGEVTLVCERMHSDDGSGGTGPIGTPRAGDPVTDPGGGSGGTSGNPGSGGINGITGPTRSDGNSGPVQPYTNAPACPDHNDSVYHGVWNYNSGCYYDHTHGINPDSTIFADVIAGWDQEISYPWETPSENLIKHKGYVNLYTEAKDGCELFANDPEAGILASNCVTHAFIQLHSLGTTKAMATRFHSFRAVARVCDQSLTNCGIVETGGWHDYGVLHCPYKTTHCPLAGDPLPLLTDGNLLPDTVAVSQPPYRAFAPLSLMDRVLGSGRNVQFWSSLGPNPIIQSYYPDLYNRVLHVAWSSSDGWGNVDPNDTATAQFICADGSCTYNHTAFQIFSYWLDNVPAGPFNGYTTRRGDITQNCGSPGPECVPLKTSAGTPAGSARLNRNVRHGDGNEAEVMEFDVCFDSSGNIASCHTGGTSAGWIKPYNP